MEISNNCYIYKAQINHAQLKLWLKRKSAIMISPQVHNKILQLFANAIVRSIADEVLKAGHFSLIMDSTQDASRKEQLSVCLRYVDSEFVPRKQFIGLNETPNTKGSNIAECINDVLIRLNLQLPMVTAKTKNFGLKAKG